MIDERFTKKFFNKINHNLLKKNEFLLNYSFKYIDLLKYLNALEFNFNKEKKKEIVVLCDRSLFTYIAHVYAFLSKKIWIPISANLKENEIVEILAQLENPIILSNGPVNIESIKKHYDCKDLNDLDFDKYKPKPLNIHTSTNLVTAFPIRQKKILSAEEQKYAQSLKEAGGIAFYSGLNSNGDLYIGNTVINAVTGKTTENEISELKSLTVVDSFNVIGGTSNTIPANFQSPVNFSSNILAEGGDYIFSNLQLRNSSGFNSTLTAVEATPSLIDSSQGDFAFSLDASNGKNIGLIRTQSAWRPSGLIGVEKIHSYKNGSDYTLNVGSDWQSNLATQTVVNLNYDLDVTANQRIGTHLDIGNAANAAIDSNTGTKQTKLQIKDNISGSPISTNTVELIKSGTNSNHNFIRCTDVGNTELFSVDTAGNVNIPVTASYGNAEKAWSVTLTVAGTADLANNECTITQINPYYGADANGNIGPGGESVDAFLGVTPINNGQTVVPGGYLAGFVNRLDQNIQQFKFVGTPGNILQYFENPNSILVFVNGVLQDAYLEYTITTAGQIIFNDPAPQNGDRITIRGLAT